jgi:hypothetical protein
MDKPIKRERAIGDGLYTLTIAPGSLKLVPKGKRNGLELQWADLFRGDTALQASLASRP